jgi:cystathionine beta-lyase family protein involved in aluminum resistance
LYQFSQHISSYSTLDKLLQRIIEEIIIFMDVCFICYSKASAKPCSVCGRPVCGSCIKNFPFSASTCIECASSIRTGLAGLRKDEEVF